MNICELERYHTISELRKKTVISKDGLAVGRVVDVVFSSNKELHSFIIGGSRWEELRELLGFIDDIDPIVLADTLEDISDKTIKIDIEKDKLRHKLEEGIIPEDAFTYNDLKRKSIYDSKDTKFGKIINMIFLPCGEPSFIIGGSWFEELGERLKFKEDVDLLLPLELIDTINDQMIKISIPLKELEMTLNSIPMDSDTQRKYLNSLKMKGQVKTRLIEHKSVEEFHDFARTH